MYPIYVANIHESQIQSITLYNQPLKFERQAILRQCTEWLQNDLEPYKVKFAPYMC